MGAAQLARLPELARERARLAEAWRERLPAGLVPQAAPPGVRRVWQTFAVLLPAGVDRAGVIARLAAEEIEAGPATYALHRTGTFAGRPGFSAAALPVADALHDRALALPLWNGMAAEEVDRAARALARAIA